MNPKGNPATLAPRFKPGEVHNPKGRPKNSISINDSIRKFMAMSPEDIDRLKVQVARAIKGEVAFPKVFKHSLDLEVFIAWCAKKTLPYWPTRQYLLERIEPSKHVTETELKGAQPDKIIIEVVDKRPTPKPDANENSSPAVAPDSV